MKQMGVTVCFIFLLFSYANALKLCDRCFSYLKVGHGSFPSGLEYADFTCYYSNSQALELSGGNIAAVSESFYNQGVACGKCYQVRCTDEDLCNSNGTKVTVTRRHRNPHKAEFILSKQAFKEMAKKGKEKQLSKLSTVISEYKSIPCVYKNHNLTIDVGFPAADIGWMIVQTLFQGGQTETKDIVIFGDDASDKVHLRWIYGGRWQALRVPAGRITFGFTVENNLKWVTHYWNSHMLPQDMLTKNYLDTGILLTEIQPDLCDKCDN